MNIKLFVSKPYSSTPLEDEVNAWLDSVKGKYNILDIKVQMSCPSKSPFGYALIMVLYEPTRKERMYGSGKYDL